VPAITLTPTSSNRVFTPKAGFDKNFDGELSDSSYGGSEVSRTLIIYVVKSNIKTDSDNCGCITEADDSIEEDHPGKLLVIGRDDRLESEHQPESGPDGCSLTLQVSQNPERVRAWDTAGKSNQVILPGHAA
jgi:hypothetical protein